jgi:L-fucose isomerase-like protein
LRESLRLIYVSVLKIKLLTFQGAPESVLEDAVPRIEKILPQGNYELTEQDPDILFFLTGGSEQNAAKQVSQSRFYILIGSRHDNSYASATEVKAYLNDRNIPSILLDEEEAETKIFLKDFFTVKQALKTLNRKRVGLIGQVSDWLISSAIPASLLAAKFGIELIEIPWIELGRYSEYEASAQFLEFYSGEKQFDLTETARVSELLTTAIQKWNLDAITVECFPMVQKEGVTACLPLAKFNNDGIPAGCEGDLTAITGMMLCKELTGIVPWIANINKATDEVCMFSHCTIAPGLVSGYSIKTHFETGKGTAVEGTFKENRVTIFRFDNKLSRAFIASSDITGRPKSDTACRTQIEVKLSRDEVGLLRQHPLGNHHLIIPGDHKKVLTLACLILCIEVL